ncbi:hypothetical protein, partial [Salmonella enterica]|uniref:hypothetical protein n=1 Tax=Salmonella enterica TaxID=28901 RepID=UPI001482455A
KDEMEEEINCLLEEYEEEMIVRENLPTISQVVKEQVPVIEHSLDELPPEYVEQAKSVILSLMDSTNDDSDQLSLHFYEVLTEEDNQEYFSHIHSSELNEALGDNG